MQVEIENRQEEIEQNFRKLITMMMHNNNQELPVVVLNCSFFLLHVHKSLSAPPSIEVKGALSFQQKTILTEVYSDHKKKAHNAKGIRLANSSFCLCRGQALKLSQLLNLLHA